VDQESDRNSLDTYRAAGGDRAVVRKDALVLHDGDRARAKAEELVAAGYRGLQMHQLIVGNSDDAAEQLAAYETVGFEEVVVRCMTVPQDDAIETLELVGSTVS
jgi:alkanesulfonate monooxygenase SsuD/methylene tetrahydromethanopterin reductase-like flavin-dependent oxidoreductase (luciferase family)